MSDFLDDIIKQKFPDATPEQIAKTNELTRAKAMAAGGGIAQLYTDSKSSAESLIGEAYREVTAKAKLKGAAQFTDTEIEYMRDAKATFGKKAVLAQNPGQRRNDFHKKYGDEKFQATKKLFNATDDVRVAGTNPWKGNKAVRRALKGEKLEATEFNMAMNPGQVARPKPAKLTADQKSSNPFLAQNWNLTAQSRLYRLDPSLANSMAARAGIKIGATRPVM
jgi:hypothetical protein